MCVSRVLHVLITCAVRASPRAKVLNSAKYLDTANEMGAVFLDFSKAFDKVWHSGLI